MGIIVFLVGFLVVKIATETIEYYSNKKNNL